MPTLAVHLRRNSGALSNAPGVCVNNRSQQRFHRLMAALAAAGLAGLSVPVLADQELAERFPAIPSVPLANLPALGNVPTFYVNLDPQTMADLLRRDREEGRRILSKERPSWLEQYVVKQRNLPVGNSTTNGFSQGNIYLCITEITATIPSWNNIHTPPASYDQPASAVRTCSTNNPWAPVTRSGTAINTLYANFGVKVLYNTAHKVQVLNPVNQNPSAVQMSTETSTSWGLAFFDTNGTGGKLQEVVWVTANYSMN